MKEPTYMQISLSELVKDRHDGSYISFWSKEIIPAIRNNPNAKDFSMQYFVSTNPVIIHECRFFIDQIKANVFDEMKMKLDSFFGNYDYSDPLDDYYQIKEIIKPLFK